MRSEVPDRLAHDALWFVLLIVAHGVHSELTMS
jgi:hypothetical protein